MIFGHVLDLHSTTLAAVCTVIEAFHFDVTIRTCPHRVATANLFLRIKRSVLGARGIHLTGDSHPAVVTVTHSLLAEPASITIVYAYFVLAPIARISFFAQAFSLVCAFSSEIASFWAFELAGGPTETRQTFTFSLHLSSSDIFKVLSVHFEVCRSQANTLP